jgi:DNA adenine methylase
MATTRLTTPLKTFGGKHYLAPHIVALMGPHVTYLEPFAGGLSVLLAKNPVGVSEIVNDLNGGLTHFWKTLRDEALFPRFLRLAEATEFGEGVWDEAGSLLADPDPVKRAWAFFVRVRQSLGGRMKEFATLTTNRTRQKMNEQCSAWLSAVDGLPDVHARLRRVAILYSSQCSSAPSVSKQA